MYKTHVLVLGCDFGSSPDEIGVRTRARLDRAVAWSRTSKKDVCFVVAAGFSPKKEHSAQRYSMASAMLDYLYYEHHIEASDIFAAHCSRIGKNVWGTLAEVRFVLENTASTCVFVSGRYHIPRVWCAVLLLGVTRMWRARFVGVKEPSVGIRSIVREFMGILYLPVQRIRSLNCNIWL